MEVGGEFQLGENAYASSLLRQRLLGWRRFAGLGWIGVTFVGLLAGTPLLNATFGRASPLMGLAIYFLVAIGGFLIVARWIRASLVRSWEARGSDNPTKVLFRASDVGLEMDSSVSTTLLRWPAVSEILPTKRHWIFIAGGLAYTLPKRFFADQATEREFIRTAVGHLSEGARARSRRAVTFVA